MKSNLKPALSILIALDPAIRGDEAGTYYSAGEIFTVVSNAISPEVLYPSKLQDDLVGLYNDGLLARTPYGEGPQRYTITAKGREVRKHIANVVGAITQICEGDEPQPADIAAKFTIDGRSREYIVSLLAATDSKVRKDVDPGRKLTISRVLEGVFRPNTRRNRNLVALDLDKLVAAGLVIRDERIPADPREGDPYFVYHISEAGREFVKATPDAK